MHVYILLLSLYFQAEFAAGKLQLYFQRADVISYDKKYFTNVAIKRTFYNRTFKSLSGSMNLAQEITSFVGSFQTHKLVNNGYKHYPALDLEMDGCIFLKTNVLNISTIFQRYKLPYKCPIEKGIYKADHFVIRDNDVPIMIPEGDYLVHIKASVGRNEILFAKIYGEIKTIYKVEFRST